jgi:hypothetical protein
MSTADGRDTRLCVPPFSRLAASVDGWRASDRLARSEWRRADDEQRRAAYELTVRAAWRAILRGK